MSFNIVLAGVAAASNRVISMSGTASGTSAQAGTLIDTWTPAEMSPTVWLEGDDPTLNFSGFTWPNPGTAADFTEATNKPVAGSMNSRQAVDFDGVNDLATDGAASTQAAVTSYWIGFVAQQDTTPTLAVAKDHTGAPVWADDSGFVLIGSYNTGSVTELYLYQFTGGGTKVTPSNADLAITLATPFYSEGYFDSGLNRMGIRLNGGADRQLAAPGNIVSLAANAKLAKTAGSLVPWDGMIGTLVVCNSQPSTTDVIAFRRRCNTRWGVTTP